MNMSAYREELRLKLTGGVLDLSYYESKFDFNDFYYFYDEYFKSQT